MKTGTQGTGRAKRPPVPEDPFLRLVEYLLVLRAPIDPVRKEARLRALENPRINAQKA